MSEKTPPPVPTVAIRALEEAREARGYVQSAVRVWNTTHEAQERALADATEELRLVREAVMMLAASQNIERSLSLEVSRHLSSPPPMLKSQRVREIAQSISNETELEKAREDRKWWMGIVATVIGGIVLSIVAYLIGHFVR